MVSCVYFGEHRENNSRCRRDKFMFIYIRVYKKLSNEIETETSGMGIVQRLSITTTCGVPVEPLRYN